MQTGSWSICMTDKDLNAWAYIDYRPLYNPFMGSQVFMLDFTDDLKPHLKQKNKKIDCTILVEIRMRH